MKKEIKVPPMGESISEATVAQILKPSGSAVAMDEELLELETDKVNQVLYASANGVVYISVAPGDVVKIGQVIGDIDTEGAPSQKEPAKTPQKAEEPPLKKPKPLVVPEGAARITRMAYAKEIQAPPKAAAPLPVETPALPKSTRNVSRKKMSKIRTVIAQRLVEVQNQTAMLTTFNEVDMTTIMSLREQHKERFEKQHGCRLGFMSFFVKACVSALQSFPEVNSYIEGDEIVHREYYDIGIAVSTERGLMVPVVRDCDKLTFAGIETAIQDYGKKGRDGRLAVNDLQGGGFTITNGGVFGSLLSTPILNPPQCAILGMHKIQKRPVVVEDQIVIRPMMYLAMSYDHRLIDGKEAVSFLVHVKECLEDPSRILLEV